MRTRSPLLAAALAVALVLSACGSDADDGTAGTAPTTTEAEAPTTTEAEAEAPEAVLAAADLRVTLNRLLAEHVFLAGAAVNEAFAEDAAGFEAAAAALDDNSVELSEAVGLAYGDEAADAFLDLWRTHIDLFVRYVEAVAAGDEAEAEAVVELLVGYAADFAAFLEGPTGLGAEVLEELVLEHIVTLAEVVDVAAAGEANPFLALREAMAHMHMVADPLAVAIAEGDPERFPGDPTSPEATLQRDLDLLLEEHVLLAGAAVNEALRGNTAGFEAAAAALDANSVDLAAAVGGVLGDEAGDAFLDLWRTHIDLFVRYAEAVAAGDEAEAEAVVELLVGYAADFAAFLEGPTGLGAEVLEELVLEHIVTLAEVVDVAAAGDANPFLALREAAHHMTMIAGPLAAALA